MELHIVVLVLVLGLMIWMTISIRNAMRDLKKISDEFRIEESTETTDHLSLYVYRYGGLKRHFNCGGLVVLAESDGSYRCLKCAHTAEIIVTMGSPGPTQQPGMNDE